MRKHSLGLAICLFLFTLAVVVPTLARQTADVTAEAVGQANLRAATDVNAELRGQIVAGTRYPVIGRSQFYPWVLIADPSTGQPLGWVFQDLVTVQGNLDTIPFTEREVSAGAPLPTPSLSLAPTTLAPDVVATEAAPEVSEVVPTVPAGSVMGLVLGEINIRYGPGVEYPRVGVGREGDRYEIVARHTQLPWLQIRYPEAPNGLGWVAQELLEVEGNLDNTQAISRTQFDLPTLTPTESVVQASALLASTPVSISPAFQSLGDQLWQMMLNAGFDPKTSRMGALFLMDLQTGEAVTFGNEIAFSGMSLSKIEILAAMYNELDSPPDNNEAVSIVESLMCSENISTNELLTYIGGGNPFAGAQTVTQFLQTLGLRNTFITAPYDNDPFITPQAAGSLTTEADQISAGPDPYNQVTVDELGWLLSSIYQCGYGEGGVLLERFPQTIEPRECRQMLHVMSANRINALIEMGVPANIRVAHKHGWIPDTHGDAGIVFTPGGDYVMVVVLRNPTWIDYSESFPLIADISRVVYNYYNPDAPLDESREGEVNDECTILGNPVVQDLMSSTFEG